MRGLVIFVIVVVVILVVIFLIPAAVREVQLKSQVAKCCYLLGYDRSTIVDGNGYCIGKRDTAPVLVMPGVNK